jgi:hypothetical protein
MAMDKAEVLISKMQRVLEIRDYKTAWLMAHKVFKAMADRDAGYRPVGLIEMDDLFFGPKGSNVSHYNVVLKDPKAAGTFCPKTPRYFQQKGLHSRFSPWSLRKIMYNPISLIIAYCFSSVPIAL